MKNDILLRQIELYIAFLRKLSPNEIYDLESGTLSINFIKQYAQSTRNTFDSFTYGQYAGEIQRMSSREECLAYFKEANLQKKDLEGILKYLGVTFNKKDTKAKLQAKIIENTIGKKLRDDAIINK